MQAADHPAHRRQERLRERGKIRGSVELVHGKHAETRIRFEGKGPVPGFGQDTAGQGAHEPHGNACLSHLPDALQGGGGDVGGLGNDEDLVGLMVNAQTVVFPVDPGMICRPVCKNIRGDEVVPHLVLREHAANGLRALGFPAGPVGLGVVEDRGADKRVSALDQVADAFHIPDETAEMTVLGVMPVRIEMRRAVFVGERRGGEGMGHKVVDAAHHEVVGEVFFQRHALAPSVIAEDLAHRVPVLFAFNGGCGRGERAEGKMIECAVPVILPFASDIQVFALGQDLSADIVNPGHILSLQTAEIMPEAGAAARMLPMVLNEMPDIAHAVRAAPGADLFREILLHQARDDIHIAPPCLGSEVRVSLLIPEKRQAGGPRRSPGFPQRGLHFIAPWQVFHFMKALVGLVDVSVAELRLIGKEAENGAAEFIPVMPVVRLVHGVDERAAGGKTEHVHVIPVRTAVAGEIDAVYPPFPVRRSPGHAVLPAEGDSERRFRALCEAYRADPDERLILKARKGFHEVLVGLCQCGLAGKADCIPGQGQRFPGVHFAQHAPGDALAEQRIVALFHRCVQCAVAVAGREVTVVENPDLHVELPGFLEDDIQVVPPFRPAEVRMRAALEAHGAAAGVMNDMHVFAQCLFILAAQPEKGKDRACRPSLQEIFDSLVHDAFLIFPAVRQSFCGSRWGGCPWFSRTRG